MEVLGNLMEDPWPERLQYVSIRFGVYRVYNEATEPEVRSLVPRLRGSQVQEKPSSAPFDSLAGMRSC